MVDKTDLPTKDNKQGQSSTDLQNSAAKRRELYAQKQNNFNDSKELDV